MSGSAHRDVARSVGEALDLLRRPGHEFGRDFLLGVGNDLPGDLSLLANPEVTRNTTGCASEYGQFALPTDNTCSSFPVLKFVQAKFLNVPIITGNLSFGLCVACVECSGRVLQFLVMPFLHEENGLYYAGRYVRSEATGEYFVHTTPFGGVERSDGLGSVLLYVRIDSAASRVRIQANMRVGVTLRQVYDDYCHGDQEALGRCFTFLQKDVQVAANGCPKCGLAASRDCDCELIPSLPKSSHDFSSSFNNFLHMFGSFRVSPAMYFRDMRSDGIDRERTFLATRRDAKPLLFRKLKLLPSSVTYASLDSHFASHLLTSCVENYMQICCTVPRLLAMPRVTACHRNREPDGEPRRCHWPVAKSVYTQLARDADDSFASAHRHELQDATRRVLDTGIAKQATPDPTLSSHGHDEEHSRVNCHLNLEMLSTQGVQSVIAPENLNCAPDISERISQQTFSQDIISCPLESTGTRLSPAATLRTSSPHRPEQLHSYAPTPLGSPSSSQLQPRTICVAPQSEFAPAYPPFAEARGTVSVPEQHALHHESAPEFPLQSGPVDGSSAKRKAKENLTRQEKNRRAAARSNERRKQALTAMKRDIAEANAEVLCLRVREAKAKSLNLQLKEEATQRWKRLLSENEKKSGL